MADESQNFTALAKHIAEADIDFGADTFYLLLLDNGAKPTESELDTWIDRADVDTATREVTGTGYTAGGVAVTATVEASADITNNNIEVTFTNLAPGWTTSTISSIGGILYKSTGAAANDLLISFVDFDATVSSTAGDFNVTFLTPLTISV